MAEETKPADQATAAEPKAAGKPRLTPFSQLPMGQVYEYNGSRLKKVSHDRAAELHDDAITYPVAGQILVEPVIAGAPDAEGGQGDGDERPTREAIAKMRKPELVALADRMKYPHEGKTVDVLREEIAAAIYPVE